MKIGKITLRNFRNISSAEFSPGPGLNFFVGANAQGKTTLLEAIEYLSNLQSFRGAKAFDLVRRKENNALVECDLFDVLGKEDQNTTNVKVRFHDSSEDLKRASRTVFLHEKRVPSAAKYFEIKKDFYPSGFNTVVFNPSDHSLVHGEPRERRQCVDQAIGSVNPTYLMSLKRYQRALEQRNTLLKERKQQGLKEFTDILLEEGSFLIEKRMSWWQKILPELKQILFKLAPHQSEIKLFYKSSAGDFAPDFWDKGNLLTRDEIFRRLRSEAQKKAPIELEAGVTLFGPHREDWFFMMGDQPLSRRGSRGEVRTTILALKLSQVEWIEAQNPSSTVFLLDDFSSELDPERRKALLDFLEEKNLQAFITTTEECVQGGTYFEVMGGEFRPMES